MVSAAASTDTSKDDFVVPASSDQTGPVDPDTRVYEQLHVDVSGTENGPPVILLHGWGSSASMMEPIARLLADAFRVFNFDLPGHGQSPVPERALGVPEHAEIVAEFIRHKLEGRPPAIIGHSNGGRIALYLASNADTAPLVDRLVLISPSGIKPRRTAGYYLRSFVAKTIKLPFRLLRGRGRDLALDWLHHSLVWRWLGSSDYNVLTGVMRESFVKTVNCYLDHQVSRISCPTLVFWGDQDRAVSRRQMDVLERDIRDSGVVVLNGAGHYGYLDSPAIFNAACRYFLEIETAAATDDTDDTDDTEASA
jgi:pimeloyl-ACP methyl ester carboxylesterase